MFYNMFCWSFAVLNDGDHTLLCCSLIEIKNSDMLPMQFWYSASKINFPYEKNWTLAVVWGETYRPIHIYFIYKKPSNKIRSLHLILTCMNCARSARTSLWAIWVDLSVCSFTSWAYQACRNGEGRTSWDGSWAWPEVFVNFSPSLRGKCHVITFENRKLFYIQHQKSISPCYSNLVFLTYCPFVHYCPLLFFPYSCHSPFVSNP